MEFLNPAKRHGRRRWLLTVWLCLSVSTVQIYAPAPSGVDEYRAKAAFLYNVCKFVSWPESAMPPKDRPFVIGVVGNHPLMSVFARELAGKSIGGRKIEVRSFARLRDGHAARALYCDVNQLRELTRSSRSRLARGGVLTVGDGSECLPVGSVLALGIRDGRLAFEVNVGAARRAGLEMDANLLGLAAKVVDE